MRVTIELTVNNHPGVMNSITSLFSRRGFNLDGILCSAFNEGELCTIYLLVKDDEKLTQVVKQAGKLYDVKRCETHRDDEIHMKLLSSLSAFE